MLVLRGHVEQVSALSEEQWLDLHRQIAHVTGALQTAFAPEHFNYAFLQNQDRHVHLHVIPRYANVRAFNGLEFIDPDYPSHYRVPGPSRRLSAPELGAIAEHLRHALSAPGSQE
jgi:diadenosine tetraphosphate (Ap4A) HIT family hydrolase